MRAKRRNATSSERMHGRLENIPVKSAPITVAQRYESLAAAGAESGSPYRYLGSFAPTETKTSLQSTLSYDSSPLESINENLNTAHQSQQQNGPPTPTHRSQTSSLGSQSTKYGTERQWESLSAERTYASRTASISHPQSITLSRQYSAGFIHAAFMPGKSRSLSDVAQISRPSGGRNQSRAARSRSQSQSSHEEGKAIEPQLASASLLYSDNRLQYGSEPSSMSSRSHLTARNLMQNATMPRPRTNLPVPGLEQCISAYFPPMPNSQATFPPRTRSSSHSTPSSRHQSPFFPPSPRSLAYSAYQHQSSISPSSTRATRVSPTSEEQPASSPLPRSSLHSPRQSASLPTSRPPSVPTTRSPLSRSPTDGIKRLSSVDSVATSAGSIGITSRAHLIKRQRSEDFAEIKSENLIIPSRNLSSSTTLSTSSAASSSSISSSHSSMSALSIRMAREREYELEYGRRHDPKVVTLRKNHDRDRSEEARIQREEADARAQAQMISLLEVQRRREARLLEQQRKVAELHWSKEEEFRLREEELVRRQARLLELEAKRRTAEKTETQKQKEEEELAEQQCKLEEELRTKEEDVTKRKQELEELEEKLERRRREEELRRKTEEEELERQRQELKAREETLVRQQAEIAVVERRRREAEEIEAQKRRERLELAEQQRKQEALRAKEEKSPELQTLLLDLELRKYNLTVEVEDGHLKVLNGGCAEIFVRVLKDGTKIAEKKVRLYSTDDLLKVAKRVTRELRIWSRLKHINVLPFRGFIKPDEYEFPSIITIWMELGSLRQFIDNGHPVDNYAMIKGMTDGLAYLHGENVVHGDLKAENVVVSPEFVPKLMDFGISHLLNGTVIETATRADKGSLRWAAPELLLSTGEDDQSIEAEDDKYIHTNESDIWALGMTYLEVLTKKLPYYYVENPFQIVSLLFKKQVPSIPIDFDDSTEMHKDMWELCQLCWNFDAVRRPPATELATRLARMVMLRVEGNCHSANDSVQVEHAATDCKRYEEIDRKDTEKPVMRERMGFELECRKEEAPWRREKANYDYNEGERQPEFNESHKQEQESIQARKG